MHLLLTFISIQMVQSARILGIFYMPVYTHFTLGETVFKELASRGHEVTVLSAFPQKEKIPNYKDIFLSELKDLTKSMLSQENLFNIMKQPAISTIKQLYDNGHLFVKLFFRNKDVQALLKSNETFDAIILEQSVNEAHFGFMHRFKAPLILMTTSSISLFSNGLMGNPIPFACVPNIFMDYSPQMNFWQRIHNVFVSSLQVFYYHNHFLPEQDRILRANFPDAPPIYDLINNASLILLNSHSTSAAAVPLLPNVIEIGGFHVNNRKALSKDLKEFLDEAKEGVIYFSMGSNFQSNYLSRDTIYCIFKVFSKLKMKVLCKWEDDRLPGQPENVRMEKWLPQEAVLAHENVKVFITHGGRRSIIESIYYGKPILGIPLYAEQRYNMREAAYLGYGVYLSYDDINEENLTRFLEEITENPRYAKEASYRSQALRDLPTTQLDKAIGWIEYIVKHKSAPHLRNAGIHLRWYQYLLLDVALFCCTLIWVLKKFVCIVLSNMFKGSKEKIKIS